MSQAPSQPISKRALQLFLDMEFSKHFCTSSGSFIHSFKDFVCVCPKCFQILAILAENSFIIISLLTSFCPSSKSLALCSTMLDCKTHMPSSETD